MKKKNIMNQTVLSGLQEKKHPVMRTLANPAGPGLGPGPGSLGPVNAQQQHHNQKLNNMRTLVDVASVVRKTADFIEERLTEDTLNLILAFAIREDVTALRLASLRLAQRSAAIRHRINLPRQR